MLSQEEYRDYCERFRVAWKYLNMVGYDASIVIPSLCLERSYDVERMHDVLEEVGVCYVDPYKMDTEKVKRLDHGDLGLISSSGQFMLYGRYIIPIRDMLGNIIALVGWANRDDKKYVTTPSRLFSKECLFFGMEQFKSGMYKKFFLVEGIFDCISVRSLGYRCVAMMGITPARYKTELYGLMGNIIAIPDADKEGRKVIHGDGWNLPARGKYLSWAGSNSKYVKDIDDFIRRYEVDDVKDVLSQAWSEPDRIVTIEI